VVEELEASVAVVGPGLQLTGRGDEGLHGGRVGHAGAMEGGQWPRSRDGGELRALRSSRLSSEK